MKAKNFERIATGWSDKLVWNKDELKKAGSLLFAICKANGGEIAGDVALTDELHSDFRIRQLDDALARKVSPYVKTLRDSLITPMYSQPVAKKSRRVVASLVAHEWSERININTDDVDTLCRLPDMDRKIAQEVIRHRKKNGRFSGVEQLSNIKGLKAATLAALKHRAFCRHEEDTRTVTDELKAFMKKPTFSNYVASIIGKKNSAIWSTGKKEDVKQHILAELEQTLSDVKKNGCGVSRNLRFTRASTVMKEQKHRSRAAEIRKNRTEKPDCAALLYDGQYHPFVTELLASAKKSIRVMMFFMKYEEGNDYIANPLIGNLVKAHKKGLDVKVLLDKDAQDDVIGSRLINLPAFEYLTKNNVPVFYDLEGRMTHTKLVIVDGEHVVLGSHNWTGGSFLVYNDTSVYVSSKDLAAKYDKIMSDFLTAYSKA